MELWKVVLIIGYCALYAAGGQGHGWMRRFAAPAVLALTLAVFGGSLIATLLPFIALLLPGYGVKNTQDIVWKKVLFRGIQGLGYSLAVAAFALAYHNPVLAVGQILIGIAGSVFFGVVNPIGSHLDDASAALTDTFIALSYIIVFVWVG